MSGYVTMALALVPHDTLTAGWLLCRQDFELGRVEGDYEGARRALGGAQQIAWQLGDIALEAQALTASGNVDFFHLHLQGEWNKVWRP